LCKTKAVFYSRRDERMKKRFSAIAMICCAVCVVFTTAIFISCNPKVEVQPIEPDRTPPASVTNVSVLATTDTITVSWTNPSDTDFSHTEVSMSGVENTQTVQGSRGAIVATCFYDLTHNTEYTISFVTVDTNGNKSSATTVLVILSSRERKISSLPNISSRERKLSMDESISNLVVSILST